LCGSGLKYDLVSKALARDKEANPPTLNARQIGLRDPKAVAGNLPSAPPSDTGWTATPCACTTRRSAIADHGAGNWKRGLDAGFRHAHVPCCRRQQAYRDSCTVLFFRNCNYQQHAAPEWADAGFALFPYQIGNTDWEAELKILYREFRARCCSLNVDRKWLSLGSVITFSVW
jgi:hypothetical protein